ncbi:hypothetical protein E5554_16120 [Sphingobium sp. PAMC28499]|uniref:hypothetical protein n=1 Tax=Sphingobium sp. PAMC28499 TaxID=2565554 RepID=UPI00109DB377|nr:hypothetical protein [Sphingobium sp. PAMC28499]QCB39220.1 hypothetical protein E5554_16120 [Sphingobium sp. PAMC28499]
MSAVASLTPSILDGAGQSLAFNWKARFTKARHIKLFPASRVSWDGVDFFVRTSGDVPSAIVHPVQGAIVAELAKKQPLKLSLMYDGYPETFTWLVIFAPNNSRGRKALDRIEEVYLAAVDEFMDAEGDEA